MDPLAADRWTEIDTLFDAALNRPPDERTAWLRAECGADPDLYRAVATLLASDAAAERALGERAAAYASDLLGAAHAASERDAGIEPGTRLGPYRIDAEIGGGGMGVVYRAVRADGAFEKAVALKVVKRGMDTDAVLARFRHDRRILATLDHPGIARVLDAGAAPDGRPWLAMELVDGEPLTTSVRRQRLGLDARLALFEQVCEAVAYAHRRLVVHRDLKPSNILVASGAEGCGFRVPGSRIGASGAEEADPPPSSPRIPHSSAPHVKLLDFGIARLLAPEADGPITRPGMQMLTPEYAAPEQLAGEPVTAAADVYALGVVLYEVLAGTRPAPVAEPPSAAASGEVAAEMGLTPETLCKRLRGDLDTLVLAALQPDPERRYPTAQALLDDLRLWRQRRPLRARPDSVRYRAGRFVARHRAAVVAVGAVVLLFASGVAWTTWRIANERDAARAERDRAEATAGFVTGLFDAADPFAETTDRLDTLRARDLLARGATRARTAFADAPATLADVLTTIGEAQIGLGLYAEADSILAEAVTGARASGEPVPLVRALIARGRAQTQGETPAEAVVLLRDAVSVAEAEAPDHLADALFHLGAALRRSVDYDAAALALGRARGLASGDPLPLAAILVESGRVEQDRGNLADAERLHREALALRQRSLGPRHPQVAASLEMVGTALLEQGQPGAAAPLLEAVWSIRRETLGETHPQTASARFNLAALDRDRGRYVEALEAFREILALDREQLGPDHPYVGGAWLHIGITHGRAGTPEAAIGAYQQALAVLRRTAPDDDHPISLEAIAGIGHEMTQAGRASEGEPFLRRALATTRRVIGEDSWQTGVRESALGESLWRQRRTEEAEPFLVSGYERIRAAQGPEGAALRRLVGFYTETDRPEKAAPYRQRLADIEA